MKRAPVSWQTAFLVGLLGVGALPWLTALLGARPGPLLSVYAGICHQRPERTLELMGTLMLCCSRCAGIYAGFILGAVVAVPGRWLGAMRWVVLATGGVMFLEVVTQDLGLHPVWHPSRVATGAAFGVSIATWVSSALREDRKRIASRMASVASTKW